MKRYSGTLSYLPENEQLPEQATTLDRPLPKQFKQIEGDFNFVLACNTTHCSYNVHTAPDAKLDDGFVHLVYVKDASRWTMLKVLLALDSGDYLKYPEVKLLKTRAFRLEPKESTDVLTLDGEVIPCKPIHCRVNQAAINVLCNERGRTWGVQSSTPST